MDENYEGAELWICKTCGSTSGLDDAVVEEHDKDMLWMEVVDRECTTDADVLSQSSPSDASAVSYGMMRLLHDDRSYSFEGNSSKSLRKDIGKLILSWYMF